MSDSKFDWKDLEDDLVVPRQRAIAVYENQNGEVVIRQAGDHPDEDSIIVLHTNHVPALIEALQRHIDEKERA